MTNIQVLNLPKKKGQQKRKKFKVAANWHRIEENEDEC